MKQIKLNTIQHQHRPGEGNSPSTTAKMRFVIKIGLIPNKTRAKNLCKYLLLAGAGGRINFVSCLILAVAVAVAGVDTAVIPKQ